MDNVEALKRILKRPLEGGGPITESIGQFLKGVFDAGKLVGFKQGYEQGKEDEHGESRRPFGR